MQDNHMEQDLRQKQNEAEFPSRQKEQITADLREAEKVLVGIGGEWKLKEDGRAAVVRRLEDEGQSRIKAAYDVLAQLIGGKDYFVVTTVTDGAVYDTALDPKRVVAPCGNIHWKQCSKSCVKDIWEEGEIPEGICPHCGAPLTGNTIEAENYIEEGYLPQWEAYKRWQAGTLNKKLVILELGEGFKTPTVIRWPFEKIAFFNQKASFYRIHESLYQLPKEIEERAVGIKGDSVSLILSLAEDLRL